MNPTPEARLAKQIAWETVLKVDAWTRENMEAAALAAITAVTEMAAAGPWQRVGSFDPDPDALYLVQGAMRTSVKRGADIDPDNIAAALINIKGATPNG